MIFMKLIQVCLLAILLSQAYGACPQTCNCTNTTSPTYRCLQCLQVFHRVYSIQQLDCPCTDGFREQPRSDYCCPSNCSVCADVGCVSCRKNWQLKNSSNVAVCVCQLNYDLIEGDCLCLSITQPRLYYQSRTYQYCLPCPDGCVCFEAGCYNCTGLNRLSTADPLGGQICPCESPYVEIDNVCQLPAGCSLDDNGEESCIDTSNRYKSTATQKWLCKSNYMDINGECQCLAPFIIVTFVGSQQCVCSSQKNPTDYYSQGPICRKCPSDCMCNDFGCVFCPASSNRLVFGGKCECEDRFVEILGICVCVEPYYIDPNNGSCECMSQLNDTQYGWIRPQWSIPQGVCYKCPSGCSCEDGYCNSCAPSSLRTISVDNDCNTCIDFAEQVNGACRCNLLAQLDINDYKCKCKNSTTIYTKSGFCVLCPVGCTCSAEEGCHNCSETAYREILYDYGASSIAICVCRNTFTEVDGKCSCPNGQLDEIQPKCICLPPYTQQCWCDQINAYLDLLNNVCITCPPGCTCDVYGCKQCRSDSLRRSFLSGTKWECPCVQRAIFVDQKCKYCQPNSYFLNGECIQCKRCLTCNQTGCLTCSPNLNRVILDDKSGDCVCKNSIFINHEGKCVCPNGTFVGMDANTLKMTNCTACPKNCLECTKINNIEQCTSCRQNSYRFNSPLTNCPCLVDYKENETLTQYCCHRNCSACDQNGCTGCSIFNNRQLENRQCICVGNLIEIGNKSVCGCADGQYVFMGNCLPCPPNCLTCSFNYTANNTNYIKCLTCPKNSNRNSGDSSCSCLSGFGESNPIVSFCTPSNCQHIEPVCSQCKKGYLPVNNGSTCRCLTGYFETPTGECQTCSKGGCVDCSSSSVCLSCNETAGYYLTGSSCKPSMDPSNYIFSQNREGITVQLVVQGANSSFALKSFEAFIDFVNSSSANSVYLTVNEAVFSQGNIITARVSPPSQTYDNSLIAFSYLLILRPHRLLASWNGTDIDGPFTALGQAIYLKRDRIFSESIVSTSKWWLTLQQVLTGLIMIACYPLYLKGFKHNQIIFFLQTLAFMSFTLKDDSYTTVEYLYELRLSYLGLGNVFTAFFTPHYLEHSTGNFPWLTTDSNILRVAGIPLAMTALMALLSLLLRAWAWLIGLECCRSKSPCFFAMFAAVKKPVYRTMEFVYKTCMYPLVFFSLITLSQWGGVSFVDPQLKQACNIICAVLVGGYALVTVWQVFFETVAHISKFDNLCEFLSVALCSLIIVWSVHSTAYLTVIAVVALRAGAYVVIRVRYFRHFSKFEFIRLGSAVLESLTLSLMLTHSPIALWVSTLLTVGVMLAHQILVLKSINATIDQSRSITVSESIDSSSLEVKEGFPTNTEQLEEFERI